MTNPIAYEWAGMTFCPPCAHRSTAMGMLVGGLPFPADMDEAIATIALVQIERGLPIETPIAVMETAIERCQNCDQPLARAEEEVA